MQISLQFDEFFWTKNFKILISRRFEIFTKTSHLKLVGTACRIRTCVLTLQKVKYFDVASGDKSGLEQ